MIKRTLTIKVQGNRCVCDAPLYLHTQDKNIHVIINVTNTKFEIKDDMLLSFTLIKPNGYEVDKSDCYIDKCQCHLLLSGEDFDEETEVGTHLVQLKLYDEDRQSRINIPPFAMHVLKSSGSFYADEEMEGLLAEQNAYKLMTENKLALEMSQSVLISDLPTTTKVEGYAPVTQGDTTYKLDMTNVASKTYVATEIAKIGEEIDLSSYATKDDLANGLTNKANKEHTHTISDVNGLQGELDSKAIINHTHSYNQLTDTPTIPSLDGYATETYVQTKIAEASLGGEIDLSSYATKDEVKTGLATKSDVEHTHSEYLTEHQDISMKADRSEIPTLTSQLTNDSGFITTIPSEYVTDEELNAKGYLTKHQSLDHLATKQELTEGLDTKAEVNHTHSYNDLTDKPTIPSIDGLATTEYVDNAVANVTVDTSDLVTKEELANGLNGKANLVHTHDQYLTEHQDLSDYALKTELPTVPTKVSELTNDSGYLTAIPSEYITETELDAKGYLTEHQDISGLATKQELTDGLRTKSDTTHNHDTVYAPTIHEHSQYLTEHQDISNLATKQELTEGLTTKADATHTHTASEVSGLATVATSGDYNDLNNTPEIPTTLPANGGNADTVGGYTIWVGTLVEYDALSYKDANTVYMIKEE